MHAAHSDSLMLSLFKLFVKNFFQVFSNFFQALSFKKLYSVITELVSAVALASDFVIIPEALSFVNRFQQEKTHK